MGMRNFAIVLCALCASACSSADVHPLGGDGYELSLPKDVFSSKHAIKRYAAETADDLCPHGWVKEMVDEEPSDLQWTVHCAGIAGTTIIAPAPKPVTVAPGVATAPPEKL
jgi:hypothetical protein